MLRIVIPIAAGLAMLLGSACGLIKNPEEVVAQSTCEQFVSARLTAPASAKFSPWSETRTTKQPNGGWSVGGYVDSQNNFGALIRMTYNCVVSQTEGTWNLDGIAITPR